MLYTETNTFKGIVIIKELIASGYIDVFCLQTIKGYIEIKDSSYRLPAASARTLSHLSMILKSDLCLTIWKTYLDQHQNSNTLQHLRNFIEEHYPAYKVEKRQISLPSETAQIRNDICTMRKEFLAHNDITKSGIYIDTDEMIGLLHMIRNRFNLLCIPKIDRTVMPLTDRELNALGVTMNFGFGHMIYSSCAIANATDTSSRDGDHE